MAAYRRGSEALGAGDGGLVAVMHRDPGTAAFALAAFVAATMATACSAAGRPEHGGAWSFEAGLDPSVYVRFRGITYAEEPEVEWAAAAGAQSGGRDGRGRATSTVARSRVVEDTTPGRPADLGRKVLELQIPAGARVLVHTTLAVTNADAQLAAWLRTDAPVRATLRLLRSIPSGGRAYGARQQEFATVDVDLTTKWSRSVLPGHGAGDVYGQIEVAGPRTVFVDGLALEGQPADGAVGAPSVEMVVSVAPAAEEHAGDEGVVGVVTAGSPARARVVLSRPLAAEERLRVRLHDPGGAVVDLAQRAGETPRRQPADGALDVAEFEIPGSSDGSKKSGSPKNGPHLVEVELLRGGNRILRAARPFVVLPPASSMMAGPLEGARLGTHTRLDALHLSIAARLGFRWLRLHDASMIGQWITLEPSPGRQRFFDEAVDLAVHRGFGLLGVLEATPRWASSAPPSVGWYEARAWPPRDGATFSAYVRTAVSHYRGRIDRWEVWNEPYLDEFFHGTAAEYAELLDRAQSAGRGVSPAAWLLASVAPEGPRAAWTRAALAGHASTGSGSGPPTGNPNRRTPHDGFAFHPYDERLTDPSARLPPRLATLRALVGAAPGGSAPLWASEGTVLGAAAATLDPEAAQPAFAGVERAAAAEVAWAVDLLAGGAARVFVYQLTESPYRNDADLCLLESDGTPRPVAAALAILGARLGPRAFLDRTLLPDGVQMTRFGAPGAADVVAVLDRPDGASFDATRLGDGALDVWGNATTSGARVHLAYRVGPERELRPQDRRKR